MFENSGSVCKWYWGFINYINHDKFNLQHYYAFNNFLYNFFTNIKMSKNPSAKYYKNKGKREKKWQYGRDWDKSLPEDGRKTVWV